MIEIVHCATADTAFIFGALTFATGLPLLFGARLKRYPSANVMARALHIGLGMAASVWGLLAYLSSGV